MASRKSRSQRCGAPEARRRLAHARSFLELRRRSRSDNHHDAETLLEAITPGGKRAASNLRQLITLKDAAQYGFINITAAQLKRCLRQAESLVDFADEVVRRGGGSS